MWLRLSTIVSDHSGEDVTLSRPYAGQSRLAIGAGGGPD